MIREHELLEMSKSYNDMTQKAIDRERSKIDKKILERANFMQGYNIIRDMKKRKELSHNTLLEAARDDALKTIVKAIYISALEAESLTDYNLILAENMVDNWVKENGGATKILSNKETNSYIISRICQLVEDAAEKTVEEVEKEEGPDLKDDALAKAKEFIASADKDQVKDFMNQIVDNIQDNSEEKGEEKAEKKEEEDSPEDSDAVADDDDNADGVESTDSGKVDSDGKEESSEPSGSEESDDNESKSKNSSDEADDIKELDDTLDDLNKEDDDSDTEEDSPEDSNDSDSEEDDNEVEVTDNDSEEDNSDSDKEKKDKEDSDADSEDDGKNEEEDNSDSEEEKDDDSDSDNKESPTSSSDESSGDKSVADDSKELDDLDKEDEPDSEEDSSEDNNEVEVTDDNSKDTDKKDESDSEEDSSEDTEDDNEVEVTDNDSKDTDKEDNSESKDEDNDESDDEGEEDFDDSDLGEPIDNKSDSDITIDGDLNNKGKVFDELDKEDDVQKAIEIIRTRVADAEETFIRNNAEDKKKIDELLNKISNNVKTVEDLENKDPAKAEVAKEAAMLNKRRINEIGNQNITVFSKMLRNLSENIIKDKNARDYYIKEDGTLDINLCVESAKVMYAFLETVNTLKLENINSKYIENVLNGMK